MDNTTDPKPTKKRKPGRPPKKRPVGRPPLPAYKRKPKYKWKRRGPKRKTGPQKKRGPKPGKPNRFKRKGLDFLPYSIAKIYIQTIPNPPPQTVKEYQTWYANSKPYFMPYNPRSVYKAEWTSWNDFLGNTNSFEDNYKRQHEYSQQLLPYWEAVYLTQKLAKEHNFNTAAEYRAFHKANPTLVSQLPLAPNMFYQSEWKGWPTWLGKTVASQVLPKQNMEQYFLVMRESETLYTFYITTEGKDEARTIAGKGGLVKAYVMDEQVRTQVMDVVEINSEEYDESTRYCVNVNSILYVLDTLLITYRG